MRNRQVILVFGVIILFSCSKSAMKGDDLRNINHYAAASTQKAAPDGDKYKAVNSIDKALVRNFVSTDLRTFFLSYDTNILRSLKFGGGPMPDTYSSSDIRYMVSKNIELIGILSSIRPSTYYDMNPEDDMVVYAGLIEMDIQVNGESMIVNKPFPWACIRTVLEGLVTGSGVISSYRQLVASGASWGTVRAFRWQSLKRYGGWIMAAGAIYDIVTECFSIFYYGILNTVYNTVNRAPFTETGSPVV